MECQARENPYAGEEVLKFRSGRNRNREPSARNSSAPLNTLPKNVRSIFHSGHPDFVTSNASICIRVLRAAALRVPSLRSDAVPMKSTWRWRRLDKPSIRIGRSILAHTNTARPLNERDSKCRPRGNLPLSPTRPREPTPAIPCGSVRLSHSTHILRCRLGELRRVILKADCRLSSLDYS